MFAATPAALGRPKTQLPFLTNIVRAFARTGNNPTVTVTAKSPAADSSGRQTITASYIDDRVVIIPDAFPKAKHHELVLPRDIALQSLAALSTKEHVDLLMHMHSVAHRRIQQLREREIKQQSLLLQASSSSSSSLSGRNKLRVKRYALGFHSVPSLPMLHMHLISMDLDSKSLKNKKHYNSFATEFFLPAEVVIRDAAANDGHSTLVATPAQVKHYEGLEHGDMKCLWCGKALENNIALVKQHTATCDRSMAYEEIVVGGDHEQASGDTSSAASSPLSQEERGSAENQ